MQLDEALASRQRAVEQLAAARQAGGHASAAELQEKAAQVGVRVWGGHGEGGACTVCAGGGAVGGGSRERGARGQVRHGGVHAGAIMCPRHTYKSCKFHSAKQVGSTSANHAGASKCKPSCTLLLPERAGHLNPGQARCISSERCHAHTQVGALEQAVHDAHATISTLREYAAEAARELEDGRSQVWNAHATHTHTQRTRNRPSPACVHALHHQMGSTPPTRPRRSSPRERTTTGGLSPCARS